MEIRIGNLKHGDAGQYIGRPGRDMAGSPLANPYPITAHQGREVVLRKYRRWLWRKMQDGDGAVMAELHRLLDLARRPEGVTLLCFCAPRPCHGDVIKAALEYLDGLEREPVVAEAMKLGARITRIG